MSELGVVVLSCDKYSDLWGPYFQLFTRAWPDCPFRVHLCANRLRYEHAAVTTLLSGDDTDWSSSVRRSIAQVEQDNVLLFYDDAFLTAPVPTHRVVQNFDWFLRHGAHYLRMRPSPRADVRLEADVGLIRPGSAYRTSLFASIWRKSTLLELLKDGESAWEFELHGRPRADAYDGFYSTYSQVFHYRHGVEKGRWFPWTVRYLSRQGIAIATEARPVMTTYQAARYLSGLPRGYALHLLPPSMWPAVFRLKRSVLGALRL